MQRLAQRNSKAARLLQFGVNRSDWVQEAPGRWLLINTNPSTDQTLVQDVGITPRLIYTDIMSSNVPNNVQMAATQPTEELDPSQLDTDPDVDMAGTEANPNTSSSTIEGDNSFGEAVNGGEGQPQAQEPTAMDLNAEEGRMPLRKDVSLRELLSKMDDYAPVVSLHCSISPSLRVLSSYPSALKSSLHLLSNYLISLTLYPT